MISTEVIYNIQDSTKKSLRRSDKKKKEDFVANSQIFCTIKFFIDF